MDLRRRALVSGFAAAALAPRAWAQPRRRTLGYLSNGAPGSWLATRLAARGHVEGHTLRLETRIPTERSGLEAMAAELVALKPDALVAYGARNVASLASLTRTIPIVCGGTADPVGIGFAKSLARPGGNITGLSYGIPEVAEFLIGLMRVVRPAVRRVAVIIERSVRIGTGEGMRRVLRSFEERAASVGMAWELFPVGDFAELEAVLVPLKPTSDVVYVVDIVDAIGHAGVASAITRRGLVSFAAAASGAREGALMHYSIDHADIPGRVVALVDQVLRGANPAEIPWELPDRTRFIVNRATARTLGMDLPAHVLARATEIVG
jgi:putative tryptophan/tyrosine transport system substrate-binding protein